MEITRAEWPSCFPGFLLQSSDIVLGKEIGRGGSVSCSRCASPVLFHLVWYTMANRHSWPCQSSHDNPCWILLYVCIPSYPGAFKTLLAMHIKNILSMCIATSFPYQQQRNYTHSSPAAMYTTLHHTKTSLLLCCKPLLPIMHTPSSCSAPLSSNQLPPVMHATQLLTCKFPSSISHFWNWDASAFSCYVIMLSPLLVLITPVKIWVASSSE